MDLALLPRAGASILVKDVTDGSSFFFGQHIDEMASQPRAPLALRFGPKPGPRLDQAFGNIFEPISTAQTSTSAVPARQRIR